MVKTSESTVEILFRAYYLGMNSDAKLQRIPIYVGFLVTLVVMPSLMDPFNLPKLWTLVLGAGVCSALLFNRVRTLWAPRTKSVIIISFSFGMALLIDTLASPQDLFRSLIGVWGRNNGSLAYFAVLLLFLSIASQRSTHSGAFLIRSLAIFGIPISIYGQIQNLGADPIDWNNPGNKIILTLGNSDFASALLALIAIASLSIILSKNSAKLIRFIFICSFLMQIYLIWKSDAFQGIVILFIGSALLIGLTLSSSVSKKINQISIAWWVSFATLLFFGAAGVFGKGPFGKYFAENFFSLHDRYYHWIAATNMLRSNILFGVGLDSFGDNYRLFRVPEAIALRGNVGTGTNNAHSTFFQFAATGGVVLLLSYITILIFILYRAAISMKINDDKLTVHAVFAIWVAFQIQSFVSIDQLGLVVWGWLAGGCLVSSSYYDAEGRNLKRTVRNRRKTPSPDRVKFLGSIFPRLLLGVMPAIFLLPSIQLELKLRSEIVQLISVGTDTERTQNSKEIMNTTLKSRQPELRLQAIQYLLYVKEKDAALYILRDTVENFPHSFESWKILSDILEEKKLKQEGIQVVKKLIELDPLNKEFENKLQALYLN